MCGCELLWTAVNILNFKVISKNIRNKIFDVCLQYDDQFLNASFGCMMFWYTGFTSMYISIVETFFPVFVHAVNISSIYATIEWFFNFISDPVSVIIDTLCRFSSKNIVLMNVFVAALADCFKSFFGHYYHQGCPNVPKHLGAATKFLVPEGWYYVLYDYLQVWTVTLIMLCLLLGACKLIYSFVYKGKKLQ